MKKKDRKDVISGLHKLGCGVESGAIDGYFAINVPAKVNIQKIYSAIDDAEAKDILVADYPSIRH